MHARSKHDHARCYRQNPIPSSPFSAFDLSTESIGFGNESARVTTVAYEIRYHPYNATFIKSILNQASVKNPTTPLIIIFISFLTDSSKRPM